MIDSAENSRIEIPLVNITYVELIVDYYFCKGMALRIKTIGKPQALHRMHICRLRGRVVNALVYGWGMRPFFEKFP